MSAVPSPMTRDTEPATIDDYLAVVRSRWYMVGVGAIAGLVLAVVFGLLTPTTYQASATVLLRPLTPDPLQQLSTPGNTIDTITEREVALSQQVADETASLLELDTTGPGVLDRLKVQAPAGSDVLQFQYSHPDAEVAATRSNTFALAYLSIRNNRAQAAVAQVSEQAQTRLADILAERAPLAEELSQLEGLEATIGDENASRIAEIKAQISVLQTRQALVADELEQIGGTSISGGEIISPAVPPSSPTGLSVLLLAGIGFILGSLAGLTWAFVRNAIDPDVTSGDLAQQLMEAPVLGFVEDPHPHRRLLVMPDSAPSALHRIAARLASHHKIDDTNIVVVLSVGAYKDSMAVAGGIADGLARLSSVVCVDADEDGPTNREETKFEKVTNQQARAKGRPDWVTVTVPSVADRATIGHDTDPHVPRNLVTAVNDLVGHYDVVVVAAPPLSQGTDGLILGDASAALVVPVVRTGHTRRDEVRQVHQDLAATNAMIAGIVVIGPRRAWGTHAIKPAGHLSPPQPAAHTMHT